MRTTRPNRQTGVAPQVFSRHEELAHAPSPLESTQEHASPLQFGQDLVKVSRPTRPGRAQRSRPLLHSYTRVLPRTDGRRVPRPLASPKSIATEMARRILDPQPSWKESTSTLRDHTFAFRDPPFFLSPPLG